MNQEDFDSYPIPPYRRPVMFGWLGMAVGGGITLIVLGLAVLWFIVRVEVHAGEILILVNKTGKLLPGELTEEFGDQVVLYPELVSRVAGQSGESDEQVKVRYKGVRYDVIGEGRYFYNPYSYKRIVQKTTNISDGQMGVLVRKFGKPLPFPKTVATEPNERGPVDEILRPGRHNINLLAYDVLMFDAVSISEGHVGVVTLLSGKDPEQKNTYTVQPGEKGVQSETRPPGLEYYNPYLKQLDIVDIRSQKYDMLGADAIQFPSNDSFTISIEGTIEWAIRPEKVAEVTVMYGDAEDILSKIILPNARSISRIQGSKLRARDFISGKTRTAFQERLLEELQHECWQEGIDIKAALVRDIQPPDAIAGPISQREQADQEIDRYTNQMEEAKSEALLVEQVEIEQQNTAIGDARRDVVTVVKQAEQRKVVSVTDANRALEVAKLRLQAAENEAAAIISRGQAEANVVLFEYQARAEPLRNAVAAFGDGQTYAQMFFLERVAPAIRTVLSNTEGPFADIFKQFQSFNTNASKPAPEEQLAARPPVGNPPVGNPSSGTQEGEQ